MSAKLTWKIFVIGLRQVRRDGIMFMLVPAPVLMGFLLRFLLPALDAELTFALAPWYGLSDAVLVAMTPLYTAIICAFLILDERDEGTGVYHAATPAAERNYLAARLLLPMLWALAYSISIKAVFRLTPFEPIPVLGGSFLAALVGAVVTMLVASIADNKVEGLAVAKLMGIFMLGLPVPWFVDAPQQYFAGILPSFWVGRFLYAPSPRFFAAGLLVTAIWLGILGRIFLRKVGR
ncbi:hypothetical protein [Anaerotalea alkaliphila]|uniref:Fluoroquinolone transport system permease protein n=1 Tax=Anaerotalea alkaliphila TaxID=2662126 RepID=A0A7X5HTW9_9FIRM|nr:hypothetical protein [Anaerotalea alkaliphila]NDL66593.1 hypothetical protein [Anaerotalea alkaliphila]